MGIGEMNDEQVENFKIRLDDDIEDVLAGDASGGGATGVQGVTRGGAPSGQPPHRRNLFIAIFFTCIIGAALGFAYLDLKKGMQEDISHRDAAVTSMSRSLEARLSAIVENAEALDRKLSEALTGMSGRISGIETSIGELRSAKTDKSLFKRTADGLQGDVASLEKAVSALRSDLAAASESMQKEVADLSQSMDQNASTLQEAVLANTAQLSAANDRLAALEREKIGRAQFEASFKADHERYAELIRGLNQELGTLKYKIKSLESSLLQSASDGDAGEKGASGPGKGVIIEQTIP